MPSCPGSPKKKLMDRLFSGVSPKRKVSTSQFSISEPYSYDTADDSSSCLSRRSSLRSNVTNTSEYRSVLEAPRTPIELIRPDDHEELQRMFCRVLAESNLGNNERMLKLGDDEKWRIIQAHARAEQQGDSPMEIIERMSTIAMQLEGCQGGASGLKFLQRSVLDSLKVSFRTASVTWLQTFAENGGAELMVQIMRHIYPERNGGPQVTAMIETVKTFSNCPFGIDCFVQREGLLDTLVLFLDTEDYKIKQCIIHILTAIAYMNAIEGSTRILGAFSVLQRELGEDGRFDCLLRLLSKQCKLAGGNDDAVKREHARKFISDTLIFFNVLLEDISDFNLRAAIRAEIMRQPFRRDFQRLDKLGLEHQKEMFLAAAQADQALFDEMFESSGVLEVVPRDGCAGTLFASLHASLMEEACEKDGEVARLLMYLLMIPGGQLRNEHIALLRKVLEAVLLAGSGLTPDFSSAPIPLMALDDFVSCLAPLDQRSRSKEALEGLKKLLETTRREKESLEANLDEQINQIRSSYESDAVKLKLQLEDSLSSLKSRDQQLEALERKLALLEGELQASKEEFVRIKMERVKTTDDDISAADIDFGQCPTRKLTPPPLPPTLSAACEAPPPPPPLPAFLQDKGQGKDSTSAPPAPALPDFLKGKPPAAPALPDFLKSKAPVAPPLPDFMKKSETPSGDILPPPPPPLPPFLNKAAGISQASAAPPPPLPFPGSKSNAGPPPPSLPFLQQRSSSNVPVSLELFPNLPKPGMKLKPLAIEKLSKHEASSTFWPSIDVRTISSGIFDLFKLDQLLEAAQLDTHRGSIAAGQAQQSQVGLFDASQSKNLSITLRGVKLSDEEIISRIKVVSPDLPAGLVNMLYDLGQKLSSDSISQLAETLKSNASMRLDRPDLLFIQLHAKVEGWKDALNLMRLRAKCQEGLAHIMEQVKPIHVACKTLRDAKDLFSTLGCMLYLANYVNQGTHRANACGFRVSSLKTISSTKTTSKDTSVLDYLVGSLAARQSGWLEFVQRAGEVEAARKVLPSELEKSLGNLVLWRDELAKLRSPSIASQLKCYLEELDEQLAQAKEQISQATTALTQTFALFGEPYDASSHDALLLALCDLCREVEASRRVFLERAVQAEQRAKRLAQAKPRQRSLISHEHKFGCVDNIMDRLRGEITAAAGRPKHKT